ncbi:hypothetical protein MH122_14150 [Bacillus pumilus]|uniref:hypothetical protein n=1 Tax=Bacillus pumilus TaxID=1408 RepID=UPI0022821838|nr:hypothetical protein [Bacillus pumilus]MCY7679942.1 hypothetical protein [Bacillus pumilus]
MKPVPGEQYCVTEEDLQKGWGSGKTDLKVNHQSKPIKIKITDEDTKRNLLPYIDTQEDLIAEIEGLISIPVLAIEEEGDVYIIEKE